MSVSFNSVDLTTQLELAQLQLDFARSAVDGTDSAACLKAYAGVCAALKTASLIIQNADFGPNWRDKDIWEGIKKNATHLKDRLEGNLADDLNELKQSVAAAAKIVGDTVKAAVVTPPTNPINISIKRTEQSPTAMYAKTRKRVTPAEAKRLAEMFADGMNYNEIANTTGRTWVTVKRAIETATAPASAN